MRVGSRRLAAAILPLVALMCLCSTGMNFLSFYCFFFPPATFQVIATCLEAGQGQSNELRISDVFREGDPVYACGSFTNDTIVRTPRFDINWFREDETKAIDLAFVQLTESEGQIFIPLRVHLEPGDYRVELVEGHQIRDVAYFSVVRRRP